MMLMEEWKVRQDILNMGIDRRAIEKWFSIFTESSPRNIVDAKVFLEEGFKNPYLVYKILKTCRSVSRQACIQKTIDMYKTYKARYMSLGMDELKAEEWTVVFDDAGEDYYKEGWENPRLVFRFKEQFWEVNKIVEEFLSDGLSKEDIFLAIESAGVWQGNKVDYSRLQSFKEKHKTGQHPILTSALLKTGRSFEEINARFKFYTDLGFSSLSAQEWIAAELTYGRELTKREVTTWLSVGVDKGHIALDWLTFFPLDEAIEWYSAGLSPSSAKKWKSYGFSPEIAGALWKVGIENPRAVDTTIKEYGVENFKELAPYLDKVADSAGGVWLWLRFDRDERKMKDWISLGINFISLANTLKSKGFTPENLKDLFKYASLEEILEKVQAGSKYQEVYEYFYDRHMRKTSYKAVLKQFRKHL